MWRDKVIGQIELLKGLRDAYQADRLSHAMILNGKLGYGALAVALTIAQDLLCLQAVDRKACGSCKSCLQSSELIHPDLHMAFPVVGNKSDERKNITSDTYMSEWRSRVLQSPYFTMTDWLEQITTTSARPDINVRECVNIYQRLSLSTYSGTNRVQIIWMSEFLGDNGNRLLKLIEEPPSGTFIMLISEDKSLLLNTIKSRCRVIDMLRISEPEIAQALQTEHGLSVQEADRIAFLTEGDFVQALDYQKVSTTDLRDHIQQWMEAVVSGNYYHMKEWSREFSSKSLEERRVMSLYLLKMCREVLRYKVLGETHMRLSDDDREFVLRASYFTPLRAQQIESIHNVISHMLSLMAGNIHPRMLMFNTCLSMEEVVNQKVFVAPIAS